MNKRFNSITLIFLSIIAFTACVSSNQMVEQPVSYLQLRRADFEISEQKTAEAHTTQIFCVDWRRLFKKTKASSKDMLAVDVEWTQNYSIPIIGPVLYDYVIDKTTEYAMWELMQANPGYDVIMYPQVTRKIRRPLGFGRLYREIDVTVSARLAKIK